MLEFNQYDCYGNEYVCIYRDGTHHIFLVDGNETIEVFNGTFRECSDFVENMIVEARESMF